MKEGTVELLRKLSNAFGPSGNEDDVREVVIREIGSVGRKEMKVDDLGNLIIKKKGEERFPHIMLTAHMDEVGIMTTHVDEQGFVRFATIGGIDPRVLYGATIKLKCKDGYLRGYVGAKPPHLLSEEEMKKAITLDDLFIDVGASSKDEAESMGVGFGVFGVFDSEFSILGNDRLMGKAFDDRIGLTILISVLKRLWETPYRVTFVATVQEEVGLRGARVAAWEVSPDYALSLEGTSAGDLPGVSPYKTTSKPGRGPVITIADRSILAHPKIYKTLVKAAEELGIPYQFKGTVTGGTDAGAIHLTKSGIPSGVLSIPCRYIHSPYSIASMRDVKNAIELIVKFVEKLSIDKKS
ncbi:MAG: M42 family metallopeptidase [Candidatus Odinarchaeota archaeon]|nr:M42 family metallopeptidase [Candidatus Odinarchaeota archaeon]